MAGEATNLVRAVVRSASNSLERNPRVHHELFGRGLKDGVAAAQSHVDRVTVTGLGTNRGLVATVVLGAGLVVVAVCGTQSTMPTARRQARC